MKKRNYIAFLLIFVFSFVLVHTIVPHHHHDEVSEINNHEHNHNHDKKEHDHHNDSDEPSGLFSHPIHFLATTEFLSRGDYKFQKTQNDKHCFLTTDLLFKLTSNSIKRKPPDHISKIPLAHFYDTNPLRGPPVYSV